MTRSSLQILAAVPDSDNWGERTTNGEGVFPLCAGDTIIAIVSAIIFIMILHNVSFIFYSF